MQNLSHLLNWETGLTAGESMSGGNTISPSPTAAMSAPGSMPVNEPSVKPRLHDTPDVQVTKEVSSKEHPEAHHEVTTTDASWKKV